MWIVNVTKCKNLENRILTFNYLWIEFWNICIIGLLEIQCISNIFYIAIINLGGSFIKVVYQSVHLKASSKKQILDLPDNFLINNFYTYFCHNPAFNTSV